MPRSGSAEAWQRGVDSGVIGAGISLDDGTFIGFFCAPHREPRLSFMILKPGLLTNPIHYDEKAMDVRFIVGAERFDLPGVAEEGEIYVEIDDFNLALQFDRLAAALAAAERAWIAIPVKGWSLEIPVDGAGQALRGLLTPCR
jgi:hypothetical protein